MLVKFKNNWFGPAEKVALDKHRNVSGRYYEKGVHEIPNSLKKFLPKDAVILSKPEPEVVTEKEDLKDFDQDRAVADEVEKVTRGRKAK